MNTSHTPGTAFNVVVIPWWIYDTMKRNNMRPEEVFNYEALNKVVSKADLKLMQWIGENLDQIISKAPVKRGDADFSRLTFPGLSGQPDSTWKPPKYIGDESSTWEQRFMAPSTDEDLYLEAMSRERSARYSSTETGVTVLNVVRNTAIVVLRNGFFQTGKPGVEASLTLLRELLKVAYTYFSETEVNKTALFKRYLELLSTTVGV